MQIDLPAEAIAQANQIAAEGEDIAAVIVKALEKLAGERLEIAAVMQGVEAYQAGRHRPLADFGRDMQGRYGIDLPD